MERPNPAACPDPPTLAEASVVLKLTPPPEAAPVYPTALGGLTFDQLYHQTARTVGYLMREVHGMTNPEDIDDCMQAGYLKVWQQLQKEPGCFADKPKRYLVQAILFRSKAQRFSHQRHYHKIVYDADAEKQHSLSLLTTDRVDTWIDLERALGQVARQVEDNPAALLGLYCLITQATAQDVAATFAIGYSTLTAYKRQVKASLAAALDGYGPRPEKGRPVTVFTAPPPKLSERLVTTRLLEAIHAPAERVIYPAPVPPPVMPTASANGQRHRSEQPETADDTYPTRWGGHLTLEQIVTDPVVRRAAFAKAGRLGLVNEDQDDCVQQGFIRLWQQLRACPTLLADKGPLWVGIYVAYRGNAQQFHRHRARQRLFTDGTGDGHPAREEARVNGSSGQRPTHAPWTAGIDETLDVSRFLDALRQRYANNPRKLVALQAITGTISAKEAARQLGLHEKNFAASIGRQVREEVQALLPATWPDGQPASWQAQLARGEGLEHVAALAQELLHTPRRLLALYVVTTSASKKAVAQTFGYGLTAFGSDIRAVKRRLAAKFRRAALPSQRARPG